MATAPPSVNTLVDTIKVNSVESGVDSTAGGVGYWAFNVLYTNEGYAYWEFSSGVILNTAERSTLKDRYILVGWPKVEVFLNDAQTQTIIQLFK